MERRVKNLSSYRGWNVVLLLIAFGWMGQSAKAQAGYGATRTLSLSAFGGATIYQPDLGSDYKQNKVGYAFGGGLTYHLGSLGFSLEPRYGHVPSNSGSETYFLGNLKVEKAMGPGHRFHPYSLAGIGYGSISHPAGHGDNSIVYGIGPGLDFDVTPHIAVKGDFIYQFWNLGTPHSTFNPHGYTVAVVYRFGDNRFGHHR